MNMHGTIYLKSLRHCWAGYETKAAVSVCFLEEGEIRSMAIMDQGEVSIDKLPDIPLWCSSL